MFLLVTLHFLEIQENVAEVKKTTDITGQDVTQIKEDVTKMTG